MEMTVIQQLRVKTLQFVNHLSPVAGDKIKKYDHVLKYDPDNHDNNLKPSHKYKSKSNLCTQKWSRKNPNKVYLLLYSLIMPFVVITIASLFAYVFKLPFIFPSLGPTAFLHFAVPDKAVASPKNTLIGHFIGIVSGSVALQIYGLYEEDVIFDSGVNIERIFCAATSLAFTCFFMILFKVVHPPSGATTLIISLGILKTPIQLACIMAAVLLITIQAFCINRLLRHDAIYPTWSAKEKTSQNNQDEEDDEEAIRKQNLVGLFGYSRMNLSKLNTKIQKLEQMMNNLRMDNLLEYFELCIDVKSDQHLSMLAKFAQNNKKQLSSLKNYTKVIPYSTRVMLECEN